jgi:deoxyribodipyrimidine photolyase-related protein
MIMFMKVDVNYHYSILCLVLGDQLNASHSWYKTKCPNTLYVIAELQQETNYVKHHVQKVCAFFAAMDNFAQALSSAGHHVLYLTLDETRPFPTLCDLLNSLCKHYTIDLFEYQRPDEYRVLSQLQAFCQSLPISTNMYDSEHFLLPFEDIAQQFSKGKHQTMEYFYRKMRKRYHLLIEDGKPLGGKWNFDSDNRNCIKGEDLQHLPAPLVFENPISPYLERLKKHTIITFGHTHDALLWPTSRAQALQLLTFFCEHLLPRFGQYQDAMTCQSKHAWSLYHSRLSFAMNCKMLHPKQVIDSAIKAFEEQPERISLPQVEGFVRQILGWREFIRGVYWQNMPDYKSYNALEVSNPLPDYFWHANTKMRCMGETITQSLDYAYAHHIQRLMITGNFCLLAGIHPDFVDEWYLGIYIDALEWVELPNTRGMSQHADHGIIATKPYAGSANYINKMSDYCKHCHYDPKLKVGPNACPFNSLYWHFIDRNHARFATNPRMSMIYRNWEKQSQQDKIATLAQAEQYLSDLNSL